MFHICVMCNWYFTLFCPIVIHIGFTSSTAEVSENAGSVPLSVTRFSGTQNFNPAQVVVMEDPDTPGCLG